MCRNIKTLAHFEPPATDVEIHASVLQFVTKLSGTKKPSKVNQEVFQSAINEIEISVRKLIDGLTINAAPRNRQQEQIKAKERAGKRFSKI